MGLRESIVAYCRENIGASYDYAPSGGVEGRSYNCSYLSTCAYRAAGLTIPHWQGHQNGDGSQSDWVVRNGHWVTDPSALRPGDLVFFGTSQRDTGHVGVVSRAGSTPMIIDSTPSRGVAERQLPVSAGFVGGGWPLAGLPDEGSSAGGAGLAVDGWLGPNSVAAWQRALGTTADGVVSGQGEADKQYLPALESVTFEGGGSELVRAVQRRVGAGADGYLGPNTIAALQRWLGVDADGYLGNQTAMAVQRSINEGRWA